MNLISLNIRPLLAILVSLCASGLIYVLGDHIKENAREAITFIAAIIKIVLVYSMVPAVLAGHTIRLELFRIVDDVDFTLNVDTAGIVFACSASTLWLLTSIYSVGYMRGHGEKNQTGYYASFAMCLSAAMGICFAANMITFFIFFEVLTIATYPLVVHYRDAEGTRSGRKYLAYTLISGQIFFAAMVIVYSVSGNMEFKPGGFLDKSMLPAPWALVVFMMMIGAGIVKAGVMPLHSWLPAAMVAPTPVSALLHAVVVVKAGAFATLRVVLYVFGPKLARECGGATILAWMAVATILISSLIALKKDNLKARLAFSTIGQLSYIVLGIAILSPLSTAGALYHLVAHAFMKITLFMCAGAIFVTTHKKDISEMVGLGRRMPVTMSAFTIASLGIAGFPFFVGFVSKANIIMGALKTGQLLFGATLIVSAVLALTYLMPVVLITFKREPVNPEFSTYGEASKTMLVPLLITATVSVILGVAPNFGLHLLDLAMSTGEAVFAHVGGVIC